jgi:acyl-CoA reductase-like NAD-dependent aldehyde dehydrogenase/nicotinamidase-related amidase
MKPALLLIDLQRDFLASANLQPAAPALISRAAELLRGCRDRRIPIVHIWTTVTRENDQRLPHWKETNRWMCVAGTPGHETPEPLRPLPDEAIIHKTGFNAYASGELEKTLRALGCDSVLLAGLHQHACVRTAAAESLERNLGVYIASDAVGSNDPIHSASTGHWLIDRGVNFTPTNSLIQLFEGVRSKKWSHRSPARTAEILFEVTNSDANEVNSAASAARSARTQWRQKPLPERQQFFETLAQRLEAATDELARQLALEIGKPIRHAREEIRRAAANIRDVNRRAAILAQPKHEPAGRVRHEPLGVVGIISAWNNPVAIPLGKIAPALVYGNAVVWKPAPAATRISETLMRLFREANLPAGIVQMLCGDHTTARSVATCDDVDAVTLTGSLAAGHAIGEICARRVIPLQAELSGNNAAIVWDDAGLASAAAQIAWGAFAFGGQRCTANRRAIVHTKHFDEFVRELEAATAKLPWGDPLDEKTEIGPLINTAKRNELDSLIAAAEADGVSHRLARPHSKLAAEPWVKTGAYAQPVIACCDQPQHALVQEETMSPLLVVQRADDFEHALRLCTGVRHGLIASLFSKDQELQKKFLTEVRAGILKLNSSTAGVDVTLPFGGWKASGLGPPEHGDGDFQFYTRAQAVYGA